MTNTMPRTPIRTVDDRLSQTFLLLGIALLILGAIAVFYATFTTLTTIVVFGALLIAAGIVEVLHAMRTKGARHVMLNIVSALVYLVGGFVILSRPVLSALSFTLVFSAFFMVAGVVRIVNAIRRRQQPGWGWLLFGGLIDVALGVLVARTWPFSALWVIGLFVGVEMIVHGSAWIALSAAEREITDRRNDRFDRTAEA